MLRKKVDQVKENGKVNNNDTKEKHNQLPSLQLKPWPLDLNWFAVAWHALSPSPIITLPTPCHLLPLATPPAFLKTLNPHPPSHPPHVPPFRVSQLPAYIMLTLSAQQKPPREKWERERYGGRMREWEGFPLPSLPPPHLLRRLCLIYINFPSRSLSALIGYLPGRKDVFTLQSSSAINTASTSLIVT